MSATLDHTSNQREFRTLLRCQSLSKYYGVRNNITKAVDMLDLQIFDGEFVAIMGPSGCGKSTLLNCISTIDRPTSGTVILDDTDLTQLKPRELSRFRRERLGFIFQSSNLLDTLTARENIQLALSINGVAPKEIAPRVEAVAQRLGILESLDKYPLELSGGQQQRVAAARALITNPAIILADEPTGALDTRNTRLLLETFTHMNEEGATIVMVTHDANAASYASRCIFMKDGRLYSELRAGDKDRKRYLAEIFDTVSLLGGEVDAH